MFVFGMFLCPFSVAKFFKIKSKLKNDKTFKIASFSVFDFAKVYQDMEINLSLIFFFRCDRAITCVDCVALQDPYCAWDIRASRCSSGDWTSNMANR